MLGSLPLAGVDFVASREAAGSGFRRLRVLLKDPVGFMAFVKAVPQHPESTTEPSLADDSLAELRTRLGAVQQPVRTAVIVVGGDMALINFDRQDGCGGGAEVHGHHQGQ